MFVMLMSKETPVYQVHLNCLSLAGIMIRGFQLMDGHAAQILWQKETGEEQAGQIISSEEMTCRALGLWMRQRVIPNSDPDLDRKMLQLYGLDQVHYGRMYEYQYIGGFLSYMASADDEYWVNPCYTQCLSYALVDPYFQEMYFVKPLKYQEAKRAGGKFRACLRNP